MSNITVLTPAYNRGKLLEKLYESLCAQDCKDFEWLIVDDGSTDDTSERVEQMKQTADFPIFYHRKENGGKHTALNYAYQFIKTPLTFIVDSDDSLTRDAISYVNPQKAEYLIPIFIGELLEQGKMSVKVLKTNDTWYGMTYHEDVAAVKDSFKKMLENGVYKAGLFSDL